MVISLIDCGGIRAENAILPNSRYTRQDTNVEIILDILLVLFKRELASSYEERKRDSVLWPDHYF